MRMIVSYHVENKRVAYAHPSNGLFWVGSQFLHDASFHRDESRISSWENRMDLRSDWPKRERLTTHEIPLAI